MADQQPTLQHLRELWQRVEKRFTAVQEQFAAVARVLAQLQGITQRNEEAVNDYRYRIDVLEAKVRHLERQRQKRAYEPTQERITNPADLDTGELARRAAFHEMLTEFFSEGELQTAAFAIGVSYDDLRGESRTDKARELVLYLERRGILYRLVGWCQQQRPAVDWSGYG